MPDDRQDSFAIVCLEAVEDRAGSELKEPGCIDSVEHIASVLYESLHASFAKRNDCFGIRSAARLAIRLLVVPRKSAVEAKQHYRESDVESVGLAFRIVWQMRSLVVMQRSQDRGKTVIGHFRVCVDVNDAVELAKGSRKICVRNAREIDKAGKAVGRDSAIAQASGERQKPLSRGMMMRRRISSQDSTRFTPEELRQPSLLKSTHVRTNTAKTCNLTNIMLLHVVSQQLDQCAVVRVTFHAI